MSDRVIKASLLSSPQIDALTWFQEATFVRMILAADAYGRLDSRARMLASTLFPTKDNVTFESINSAVNALEAQGLIVREKDGDREYLKLKSWEKHQGTETTKKRPTKAEANSKTGYSEAFERFWAAYPKARHTKKADAYKAFKAYDPDEKLLGLMLEALERQTESRQWCVENGRWIPHPTTWLNQRRWEDEIATEEEFPWHAEGLEDWTK